MSESRLRVPSTDVPQEVVDGENGRHPLQENQYILKGIDILDGWRYVIGLKNIDVCTYKFIDKSEFITKPYVTRKPMKMVSLFANEIIPVEFSGDITLANDWIQYYISIDDINWHRISPMHHQDLNQGGDFPPKFYNINSNNITYDRSMYGYIQADGPVTSIRLKVIMQRPTGIPNAESYTPILEDYSLRVVLEDDFLS